MNPLSDTQLKELPLKICTKTWSRDSHGLYDYEATSCKTKSISLTESGQLVRVKNDINLNNHLEKSKEGEEFLLNLERTESNLSLTLDKKFYLNNPVKTNMQPTEKNIQQLQNKIWYVIKHDESSGNQNHQNVVNTNEDYFLRQDDIIKLGRVKYSVNEICIINRKITNEEFGDDRDIKFVNKDKPPVFNFIYKATTPDEKFGEFSCKLCLEAENSSENPLVDLCRCNGGMKYAHYECVKSWMQTKLSKKQNESKTVSSYNIKAFNCEICKTPYPCKNFMNLVRFKITDDKIFDMIEVVRPGPDESYMILESLDQIKDNSNIKSIHVIIMDGNKINLGRGHDADVRINDISVSRSHANLIYDNQTQQICLRDLKSKFGTLVLVKDKIQIDRKKILFQVGRTFIEVCTDYPEANSISW